MKINPLKTLNLLRTAHELFRGAIETVRNIKEYRKKNREDKRKEAKQ